MRHCGATKMLQPTTYILDVREHAWTVQTPAKILSSFFFYQWKWNAEITIPARIRTRRNICRSNHSVCFVLHFVQPQFILPPLCNVTITAHKLPCVLHVGTETSTRWRQKAESKVCDINNHGNVGEGCNNNITFNGAGVVEAGVLWGH